MHNLGHGLVPNNGHSQNWHICDIITIPKSLNSHVKLVFLKVCIMKTNLEFDAIVRTNRKTKYVTLPFESEFKKGESVRIVVKKLAPIEKEV